MATHFENFFAIEHTEGARHATLWLNQPERRNLMTWDFWMGLPEAVERLEAINGLKAVVVAGKGTDFSLGLDFKDFFQILAPIMQEKTADAREELYRKILQMQAGFNAIAKSPLVFIAAIHGYCLGGGLDLIAACDLRLASAGATVSLRETKVGIVADMGSLNRLPAIIGEANTRLMAFTGRDFTAEECRAMGLMNEVHPNEQALQAAGQALAGEVADNPGIVLRGVKKVLNYGQDHSVEDGKEFVATWNAAFLDSEDFAEAIAAFMEKRPPKFK